MDEVADSNSVAPTILARRLFESAGFFVPKMGRRICAIESRTKKVHGRLEGKALTSTT